MLGGPIMSPGVLPVSLNPSHKSRQRCTSVSSLELNRFKSLLVARSFIPSYLL